MDDAALFDAFDDDGPRSSILIPSSSYSETTTKRKPEADEDMMTDGIRFRSKKQRDADKNSEQVSMADAENLSLIKMSSHSDKDTVPVQVYNCQFLL